MIAVPLSALSRAELERSLLLSMGLNRRLLEAIREGTKPEWRLRRQAEDLAQHYAALLARHFERGDTEAVDRLVTERKAQRMDALWQAVELRV